jgi:dephospho-CoA kinase
MASVLGLSGGIGTGKSTVVRFLVSLGATVIDADAIVHELQAPGTPMLDEIAEAGARRRLEQIVHPKVIATIADRVASAHAAGAPLIVVDIPLLFDRPENNANRESSPSFDATVLIYASEQQQIERQMKRDGRDREAALARIRAQLPIENKKVMADIVIDNSGSLEETERQTRMLFERFTAGRA